MKEMDINNLHSRHIKNGSTTEQKEWFPDGNRFALSTGLSRIVLNTYRMDHDRLGSRVKRMSGW